MSSSSSSPSPVFVFRRVAVVLSGADIGILVGVLLFDDIVPIALA
jgi:hypothetical protein